MYCIIQTLLVTYGKMKHRNVSIGALTSMMGKQGPRPLGLKRPLVVVVVRARVAGLQAGPRVEWSRPQNTLKRPSR